jgi:hypothetical protein
MKRGRAAASPRLYCIEGYIYKVTLENPSPRGLRIEAGSLITRRRGQTASAVEGWRLEVQAVQIGFENRSMKIKPSYCSKNGFCQFLHGPVFSVFENRHC